MPNLYTCKGAVRVLGELLLAGLAFTFLSRTVSAQDECALTSKMRVYSSAFIAAGSGDLDGYELALGQARDSKVDALLFVFEGAADEGIPLSGRVSDGKLEIGGIWTEHQVEYPSKKEVVQMHSVKIQGMLDSNWFRGTLKIEGLVTPERVQLKRVSHIWTCKK